MAVSEILLQVFASKPRCRAVRSGVFVHHAVENILRLGHISFLVIDASDLEHRVRNPAVVAKLSEQRFEMLLRRGTVTIEQIKLTQPVMRIAGVVSRGVLADEALERSKSRGYFERSSFAPN